jgi:ketosteroid isomerase-like protein
MSQENVEATKRFNDAYNRRDVEGMLAELDPEVEWHPALPEALMGRGPAVYRGHGGVRSMFADLYGAFAELHVELSEIRDLGDQVLAVGSFRTVGRGSGVEMESPLGVVSDMKDGRATRILTFLDPRDALEAAGLKE